MPGSLARQHMVSNFLENVLISEQKTVTHVKKYAVTPGIAPYRNASTAMGIPVITL